MSAMLNVYTIGTDFTPDEALELIGLLKQDDDCCIGFTNGCFDLLHAGHIDSLYRLSDECNYLVVAVNSDKSVEQLKGSGRPVVPLEQRMEILMALGVVDMVFPFNEPFPLQLIKDIKPDVLLKGDEYGDLQIVGADVVKANGGKVIRAPMVTNVSTSKIIERIKERC